MADTPTMPTSPVTQEKKIAFLPESSLPKQPDTFQFRVVGQILKDIYERMLGYRIVYKEKTDKKTGKKITVISKEKAYEPLLTEWGANRIITLMYQFINEQTPFAHITGGTVLKMTNIFLKQLNADIYKNFEEYFPDDQRTITMWRLILSTIGFTCLQIMSRGIDGRESELFYGSRKTGIVVQAPQYPLLPRA